MCGSGSTKLLNTDLIRIWIHNTGSYINLQHIIPKSAVYLMGNCSKQLSNSIIFSAKRGGRGNYTHTNYKYGIEVNGGEEGRRCNAERRKKIEGWGKREEKYH